MLLKKNGPLHFYFIKAHFDFITAPCLFFSFSLPNTAPTLSDCQDIASDHLTDVHFDSGLGSGWAPSKL